MSEKTNFIAGAWVAASGDELSSINPATGETLWQGNNSTKSDIEKAVSSAKKTFSMWSLLSFDDRLSYIKKFQEIVEKNKQKLAEEISKETGKVLWETLGEVGAIIGKIDISVKAYHERTGTRVNENDNFTQKLTHKPLGVMAVFGAYNFPAHLPNGHIIPSLLAGNVIVLKPSEETPKVAEIMMKYWAEAGLPEGVINLVQGGGKTGSYLVDNKDIAGVLFTGSYATGKKIHQSLSGRVEVMLALEMGGNNPLIVHEVKDLENAANLVIGSAYITSGQRCTCARRLIVEDNELSDKFLQILQDKISKITIGSPFDGVDNQNPEPFYSTVINQKTADNLLNIQDELLSLGGKSLVKMRRLDDNLPYLTPALIDVTSIKNRADSEYFGPILQVIKVEDMDAAIDEANNTSFGLSAGLISDNKKLWELFESNTRAGIVNWNKPLTGASGAAPFGGVGHSGNLRPSAFYAADYSAYPVSMILSEEVSQSDKIAGLN